MVVVVVVMTDGDRKLQVSTADGLDYPRHGERRRWYRTQDIRVYEFTIAASRIMLERVYIESDCYT